MREQLSRLRNHSLAERELDSRGLRLSTHYALGAQLQGHAGAPLRRWDLKRRDGHLGRGAKVGYHRKRNGFLETVNLKVLFQNFLGYGLNLKFYLNI